ncbi:MAG: sugar phosphate isomerase/epimerase family protein [Actinomycetota bacterium]
MIRPAVITDEISQDFERSLDVMLEYGVRDAELRGLWGANVMDLSSEQLRRARTALDERGMRVCGIASPIYKRDLFESDPASGAGPLHLTAPRALDQQLTLLERGIELCEYFNTKLIRIFAFWRQRPLDADVLRQIVAAILPGVRRAEQAGVTLGLENEHACILGTGHETAEALRAIGSPNLRAIWDPGNAYFAGERPFPDGYAAIKEYLSHVHVKDASRGPDGKPCWTVLGEGEIDFEGQVAALLSDGYQGLLSLETHVKTPSGDPEEASRLCLDGLTRLLRNAGAWRPA